MAEGLTQILLVEDDPGDALLLTELLRDAEPRRFLVERAGRMAEAEDLASTGRFDLILLDLSLPDAQGLAAVSRLREVVPDLPILVLTGLNDPSFASAAGRAGAQDYLVKGQLSAVGLCRSIRHALERQGLEESVRRRNLEVEGLRRQDGSRREFIANVSHELRTPIAAIRGAAETLRLGALADEKNRMRFIQIIERHSARLADLVEDLLLISSLESEKHLAEEPVALEGLVAEQVKKLGPQMRRKKVKAVVEIESGLSVMAGRGHVATAFQNLLSNAVEYNKDGGLIEVSASAQDGQAVLKVRDEGVGIPAADLGQVFERFHRSPMSRVMRPDSTGLGLFIVRRVAEAYGGRVWAESVEGQGSSFFLTLPRPAASQTI